MVRTRLLALALAICGISMAADPIPVSDLPVPVVEAMERRFPDGRIVSAERDERNDFVYFFLGVERAGESLRVEIDEYGRFAEGS